MDMRAKTELAKAILDTFHAREASYIEASYRYRLSYFQAAATVLDDGDLKTLVTRTEAKSSLTPEMKSPAGARPSGGAASPMSTGETV